MIRQGHDKGWLQNVSNWWVDSRSTSKTTADTRKKKKTIETPNVNAIGLWFANLKEELLKHCKNMQGSQMVQDLDTDTFCHYVAGDDHWAYY